MELEIKLNISRENALAVFKAQNADNLQTISMKTVYFTDENHLLDKGKMMLRLRRENNISVCTFKAPLPDFGGLARLEIQYPAENIEQGVAKILEDKELPQNAAQILKSKLFPACGADFTRIQAECHTEKAKYLLSYDQGILFAGAESCPISEMELELVSGDFKDVTRFSNEICADFHAVLNEKSKAQRAFALIILFSN